MAKKPTSMPMLKQIAAFPGYHLLFICGHARHDPHRATSAFVPPLCTTFAMTASSRAMWERLIMELKHELADHVASWQARHATNRGRLASPPCATNRGHWQARRARLIEVGLVVSSQEMHDDNPMMKEVSDTSRHPSLRRSMLSSPWSRRKRTSTPLWQTSSQCRRSN